MFSSRPTTPTPSKGSARRSARTARSSTGSYYQGSTGGNDRGWGRSSSRGSDGPGGGANNFGNGRLGRKGKAQKWHLVKRPPAPGAGFLVPTWKPVADLTLEEKEDYAAMQSAKEEKERQQQLLLQKQQQQQQQQQSSEGTGYVPATPTIKTTEAVTSKNTESTTTDLENMDVEEEKLKESNDSTVVVKDDVPQSQKLTPTTTAKETREAHAAPSTTNATTTAPPTVTFAMDTTKDNTDNSNPNNSIQNDKKDNSTETMTTASTQVKKKESILEPAQATKEADGNATNDAKPVVVTTASSSATDEILKTTSATGETTTVISDLQAEENSTANVDTTTIANELVSTGATDDSSAEPVLKRARLGSP